MAEPAVASWPAPFPSGDLEVADDWLKAWTSCRFPNVASNVLQLLRTLGLIACPSGFWVPFYLLASLPIRLASCLGEVLQLDLSGSEDQQ